MSLLEERINKLISSDLRTDDYKIDSESYYQNPFFYIKKTIEKAHSYNHFNDSQDFLGVVLREITLTSGDPAAFASNRLPHFDDIELGVSRYYNIMIPDLDYVLPIPKDFSDTNTINAFYNDVSRIAWFNGPEKITPGFLVRIKHPIISQKNKQYIEIDKIYSKQAFTVGNYKKTKDVFNKCESPLKLDAPSDIIKPERIPNEDLSSTNGILIFSSNDFSSKENKENNSPTVYFGKSQTNEPLNPSEEQKKNEELKKMVIKPDTVDTCSDLPPVQNEISASTGKKKEILKTSFVKNDETTKKEEVPETLLFNSQSIHDRALIIEASEDPLSNNTVINRPASDRNISMIVVKNVPYLDAKTFYDAVTKDKINGTHFCIDNDGTVFQFTDTKNYVKCFNPTIDEISIYISLVNISFRNSKTTKELINKGFRIQKIKNQRNGILANTLNIAASALGSKPPEVVALIASLLKDRITLRNYLSGKTGETREILLDQQLPDLESIDIQPPYRLDATESQKKSLEILIKTISDSYEIKMLAPSKRGFSPDVASGDFEGIAAPFHFSTTYYEPVNFYDLVDNIIVHGGT